MSIFTGVSLSNLTLFLLKRPLLLRSRTLFCIFSTEAKPSPTELFSSFKSFTFQDIPHLWCHHGCWTHLIETDSVYSFSSSRVKSWMNMSFLVSIVARVLQQVFDQKYVIVWIRQKYIWELITKQTCSSRFVIYRFLMKKTIIFLHFSGVQQGLTRWQLKFTIHLLRGKKRTYFGGYIHVLSRKASFCPLRKTWLQQYNL